MNCQDVSLILDDRDIGALAATERREMDAHLAICPDCTRDWQIHTRLAASLAPAEPVELRGRIGAQLAAHSRQARGWRTPRRLALLTLFTTGAAAVMVGVQWLPVANPVAVPVPVAGVVPPAELVPPAAPVPTVAPAPVAMTEAVLPPAVIQAAPAVAVQRTFSGPAPAAKPVRVQVMPLLNQATGEAVAAVDAEYAAFLDALGKVPGVILVPADAASAEPAEFRLTLRGIGPLPEGKYRVGLTAAGRQADGSYGGLVGTMQFGDIAASCNTPVPFNPAAACSGPAAIAAQQVLFVRTVVLSPVPQPNDPVSLSQSVLSASNSPDPEARASAWRAARGMRLPELLPPLIGAVQQDRDARVRAHAAATLAADFSDDPRARSALETAARSDASPMVRAFVQQTLGGNQAWNAYIIDSMRDTNRSDMERLEAMFIALEQPATARFDLEGLLRSYAAIEPLTALLSRISPWPRNTQMSMLMLRLTQIEHPAVVTLLVDNVARYQGLLMGGSLVHLLSLHGSDPRVRAALEKLSASDPDPNVRKNAAEALKKIVASPASAAQSPAQ